MKHKLFFIITIISVLMLLMSCKTKFQNKLKHRKQFAKKGVYNELKEILKSHDEMIAKSLPASIHDKGFGQNKEAIVAWRLKVANSDTLSDIESLLARLGNKNPDAEKKLLSIKTFLTHVKGYYQKKIHLKDYLKYLDEYLKYNPNGAMKKEAEIEYLFVHFVHLYDLDKYEDDVKLTSMLRFWKLAFNFANKKREPFMDYITRLCNDKLKAYCKNIMYEDRPYAIAKPYMQKLIQLIDRYISKYPETIYKPLLIQVKKDLTDRASHIGPFPEYPKMPTTISNLSCVGNLKLIIGTKGIFFAGQKLIHYVPNYKYTKKAWKEVLGKIEDKLGELLDEQNGDDPFVDFVSCEIDAAFPFPLFLDLITYFQQNRVNQIGLCSRKKIDGTNQKMMHVLTLFPKKNPRLKEVIIDTTKKNVEKPDKEPIDQEIFKSKLPDKIARKSLEYRFFTGKLPLEIKEPELAAYFVKKKGEWIITRLKQKNKAKKQIVKKLDFDNLNRDAIVLIKRSKLTLQSFINYLDPLMYQCIDKTCVEVKRTKNVRAIGFY